VSGRGVAAALAAALGAAAVAPSPAQPGCAPADHTTRVAGGGECLAIRTFRPAAPGDAPRLAVFIHGDVSAGGPADYVFRWAARAVTDGTVVVAILRPGYGDSEGNLSTGEAHGRQDHYTRHNVDAVGAAVKALREHHRASRVVLAGHSGGAAFAGVIIGRHPGVADGAVLVACSCDIPQWRHRRGRPWPHSLSPHALVKQVPTSTRVVSLTGDRDDNTTPDLARDYVKDLAQRGVAARFVAVAGAAHNDVIRAPEVDAAITGLLAADG